MTKLTGWPRPRAERGAHLGVAAHRRNLAEHPVDLADDVLGGLLALLPGLQEDDDGAAVEIVARRRSRRACARSSTRTAPSLDQRQQPRLRVEPCSGPSRRSRCPSGALTLALTMPTSSAGTSSDCRVKNRRAGAGEEQADGDQRDQRLASAPGRAGAHSRPRAAGSASSIQRGEAARAPRGAAASSRASARG